MDSSDGAVKSSSALVAPSPDKVLLKVMARLVTRTFRQVLETPSLEQALSPQVIGEPRQHLGGQLGLEGRLEFVANGFGGVRPVEEAVRALRDFPRLWITLEPLDEDERAFDHP